MFPGNPHDQEEDDSVARLSHQQPLQPATHQPAMQAGHLHPCTDSPANCKEYCYVQERIIDPLIKYIQVCHITIH